MKKIIEIRRWWQTMTRRNANEKHKYMRKQQDNRSECKVILNSDRYFRLWCCKSLVLFDKRFCQDMSSERWNWSIANYVYRDIWQVCLLTGLNDWFNRLGLAYAEICLDLSDDILIGSCDSVSRLLLLF